MNRIAILLFLAIGTLASGCHRSSSPSLFRAAALFKLFNQMTVKQALELAASQQGSVREYQIGLATKWSSSTLGVADKVPDLRTDIRQIGQGQVYMDSAAITALNANFPEGHGNIAYRWNYNPSSNLSAGFYNFAWAATRENIPFDDDTRYFQYALVMDRNGDSNDNYQGQAPFDRDFFNDTDTWLQFQKQPSQPWSVSAQSAKNNNIVPFDTEAILLACDDVLFWLFPADDIDDLLYCPKCRCTAFEHGGDFGQNPPFDWSGSVRPAQDKFLFGAKWDALRKTQPQIRIETRFLEVSQNFLGDLGVNLDLIGTYQDDPSQPDGTRSRERDGTLLRTADIGGREDQIRYVSPRLGYGTFTAGFESTAAADYRAQTTLPGGPSFSISSGSEVPFTGALMRDYGVPLLQGPTGVVGELFGKVGEQALIDSILNSPESTLLEAPMLTLYNGQRATISVVDGRTPITNVTSPIRDEVEARFPNSAEVDIGYVLDIQPYLSDDLQVSMRLRLDTQSVTVPSDETLDSSGGTGTLMVPVITSGQTVTTIMIPTGMTVVLGGLQNQGQSTMSEGVPILKDLPVLNQLFTDRRSDPTKELLILVTAHVEF